MCACVSMCGGGAIHLKQPFVQQPSKIETYCISFLFSPAHPSASFFLIAVPFSTILSFPSPNGKPKGRQVLYRLNNIHVITLYEHSRFVSVLMTDFRTYFFI